MRIFALILFIVFALAGIGWCVTISLYVWAIAKSILSF
jgi:hypothetical protein